MFGLLVDLMLATNKQDGYVKPIEDRFTFAAPFPSLPPVRIDKLNSMVGIANQMAKNKGLQGRLLWVDATANLGKVNSIENIELLVSQAKDIGFNTIVFDIKPIVGYTLYPSKYTDKLTRWRDARMDINFDPMPPMIKSCKKHGISLMVSLNAFSEGHRIAKEQENNPDSQFGKAGPGYAKPDEQTVQYVAIPQLKFGNEITKLDDKLNPKTLEPDEVGMYTSWPTVRGETVMIDKRGVVVYDQGQGLPEGGRYLVGVGKGADFIYKFALPGRKLELDSIPKFLKSSEVQNQIPLMMNPIHPNVRQRVISFAKEVVQKYEIDGLLFDDRLRFGGIDSDFSPLTMQKFEEFVGKPVSWPNDVFEFSYNWNLERGVKPGKFWDAWWTWRARQLQTWVQAVRTTIKAARPGTKFGIYAGSWYGEYSKYGSNYARKGTRTGFSSSTQSYSTTGFADYLDIFIAGCYYKVPTVAEALSLSLPEGRTVESGASLANRVIGDQAWTYSGIMLQDYFDNPQDVEPAMQAAAASCQGVMIFDYSHKFETFAPYLKRAFSRTARAPHQENGLLEVVRKILVEREKSGYRDAPIYAQPGAPGVGQ